MLRGREHAVRVSDDAENHLGPHTELGMRLEDVALVARRQDDASSFRIRRTQHAAILTCGFLLDNSLLEPWP